MAVVRVQLQREWTDDQGVTHPALAELDVEDPKTLFDLVVGRVVSLGWVGMTGSPSTLIGPGPS